MTLFIMSLDKIIRDIRWWNEHQKELLPQCKGKYVAIADQQAIIANSEKELLRLLKRKNLISSLYIGYVLKEGECVIYGMEAA